MALLSLVVLHFAHLLPSPQLVLLFLFLAQQVLQAVQVPVSLLPLVVFLLLYSLHFVQ